MKLGVLGVVISVALFCAATLMRSFGPSLTWRMDDQLFLMAMAYIVGMPSMARLGWYALQWQDRHIATEIETELLENYRKARANAEGET